MAPKAKAAMKKTGPKKPTKIATPKKAVAKKTVSKKMSLADQVKEWVSIDPKKKDANNTPDTSSKKTGTGNSGKTILKKPVAKLNIQICQHQSHLQLRSLMVQRLGETS